MLLVARGLAIDLLRRRSLEARKLAAQPKGTEASDEAGPERRAEVSDLFRRASRGDGALARASADGARAHVPRAALDQRGCGDHGDPQGNGEESRTRRDGSAARSVPGAVATMPPEGHTPTRKTVARVTALLVALALTSLIGFRLVPLGGSTSATIWQAGTPLPGGPGRTESVAALMQDQRIADRSGRPPVAPEARAGRRTSDGRSPRTLARPTWRSSPAGIAVRIDGALDPTDASERASRGRRSRIQPGFVPARHAWEPSARPSTSSR